MMKDMTLTNKRSLGLLKGNAVAMSTAQSILNSSYHSQHQSNKSLSKPKHTMNRSMIVESPNHDEHQKTGLHAADNLSASSTFQNVLLSKVHQSAKEYKQLAAEYREGLKATQEKISGKPFEEFKDLQKQMRGLTGMMREFADISRSENYQVQRDIDQLNREKNTLQQQIGFYERRLEELEKTTGCSAKVEDNSFNEDEEYY